MVVLTRETMFMALNTEVTATNGMIIFTINNDVIVNGENTFTKQRTAEISKEFMEAILPVAKNEYTIYKNCTSCIYIHAHILRINNF